MKTIVYKISGKRKPGDPINIHMLVFWSTIMFWVLAGSFLLVSMAFK